MSDVVHWSSSAVWEDESLQWDGTGGKVRTALLDLGDPDVEPRPVVMLAEYRPGVRVSPHWHSSDYFSIVVQGSLTVSGREHGQGSVRRVAAGTTYGPLIAGSAGARVVDVFTDHDGAVPQYVNVPDDDQARVAQIQSVLRGRLARLEARPRLRAR